MVATGNNGTGTRTVPGIRRKGEPGQPGQNRDNGVCPGSPENGEENRDGLALYKASPGSVLLPENPGKENGPYAENSCPGSPPKKKRKKRAGDVMSPTANPAIPAPRRLPGGRRGALDPGANIRRDLFGIIDLLAITVDEPVLAIQCTSLCNVSARIKKATSPPRIGNLVADGFQVPGHRLGQGGRALASQGCGAARGRHGARGVVTTPTTFAGPASAGGLVRRGGRPARGTNVSVIPRAVIGRRKSIWRPGIWPSLGPPWCFWSPRSTGTRSALRLSFFVHT